ncbi:MAG: biotin/lipoyl-binding protein [Flavobacteriaceae bacterium]|nr:biotin/lipoyl-binding protein [Flavobacteriaceae bacterium]
MDKKYKVKVNDAFEYEFSEAQIDTLDIQEVSSTEFHVLKENHSFKTEIIATNFLKKSYTVKINSNIYEIDISNQLDLLIEEMGLSLGSAQILNDIKAPMPGLILDVLVEVGDTVKEGDYLLVLEAMKMENTLTALGDGVVKSVSVTKGEKVEKNQMLIEME